MALRAGTGSRCTYYGVLRDARYPFYLCVHRHETIEDARQCARDAKAYLDEHAAEGSPLPRGWVNYGLENPTQ